MKELIWNCNLPVIDCEPGGNIYFRPTLLKWCGNSNYIVNLKVFINDDKIFVYDTSFEEVDDYMKRKLGRRYKPINTQSIYLALGWGLPNIKAGICDGGPWMQLGYVLIEEYPDFTISNEGVWYELVKKEGNKAHTYVLRENYVYNPTHNRLKIIEDIIKSEEEHIYPLNAYLPIPTIEDVKKIYKVSELPNAIEKLLKEDGSAYS